MFSAMISQTISNNRLLAKPPRFLLVNVEFAVAALPTEDNNCLYTSSNCYVKSFKIKMPH